MQEWKIPAVTIRLANCTGTDADYVTALAFLSNCLITCYKKSVVLLIDEYNVPLENAYFEGFHTQMVDFIRSLFESVLKTNPSLYFAVITGCLRIIKELGEIMGGKVLELESERLTAKGMQQGMQQGMQKGEERLSILINRLILDGRSSQIQVIVNDKQEREKAYKEYHI